MVDAPQKDRALGLSRQQIGGRMVTSYTPHLAMRICERIAEGETLKAICEGDDTPARQTFHRWVVDFPELSRAYAAARELSAHSLEEEAVDMARDLSAGKIPRDQIRAYDVAMAQFRWSASKRNPKVFSERSTIKFTVPIQINTTIDLGDDVPQAMREHPDIYAIEAKIEHETEREQERPAKTMARKDVGDTPLHLAKGEKEKRKRKK